MIENPIAKSLKMVIRPKLDLKPVLPLISSVHNAVSNLPDIRETTNELSVQDRAVINGLLSLKKTTLQETEKLSAEIVQIKNRLQYPLLSLEALKWRDDSGWPLLVPFHLDYPVFGITYTYGEYSKPSLQPKYPSFITKCYEDVKNTFKKLPNASGRSWKWETFFSGLIPRLIIPIIKQALPLFTNIYIIAEVNGYKLKSRPAPVPKPVRKDPLIVGSYDKQLRLIAAFDITLPEAAMVSSSLHGVNSLEQSKDCIMLHQIAGLLNN